MSSRRPQTGRGREAHNRALKAAADMRRERLSLTAAARRNNTSPRTVLKHTPGNFSKVGASRRWKVRAGDTYASEMQVLTAQGLRTITVRGSKQRSIIGQHHNAVRRFLAEGEDAEAELLGFHGLAVSEHELLADPDAIGDMGERGELDEIDIYQLVAA
jgi:hypothetical protein